MKTHCPQGLGRQIILYSNHVLATGNQISPPVTRDGDTFLPWRATADSPEHLVREITMASPSLPLFSSLMTAPHHSDVMGSVPSAQHCTKPGLIHCWWIICMLSIHRHWSSTVHRIDTSLHPYLGCYLEMGQRSLMILVEFIHFTWTNTYSSACLTYWQAIFVGTWGCHISSNSALIILFMPWAMSTQ